jgi:hypothetical protein
MAVMSAIAATLPVTAASLHCINCGGPIQLRGFAHTLTVICPSCGSVLDTSTPLVQIVRAAQEHQQIRPPLPLGSRGKFDGHEWEIIGFQIRTITADGERYDWSEYVLFNPYRGFRYLTEYQGHWNLVHPLSRLPHMETRRAQLDGTSFKLFQTGQARTSYVLGEFPWRLQLDEHVAFSDYIAPPEILSAEQTANDTELTWSVGRYIPGKEIWKVFRAKGSPPPAYGVFANQPSPTAHKIASVWKLYGLLLIALILLAIWARIVRPGTEVFRDTYSFSPRAGTEASFVTAPFSLKGEDENVGIEIGTNLANASAYFDLALINMNDGRAYVTGREVSFYHGRDSDGSWSEGKAANSVTLSSIPAGQYYLRVEPQMDVNTSTPVLNYTLTVRRGVVVWTYFFLAAALLAVPPIVTTWRRYSFERARWQESDYSSFPVLKAMQ